MASASKYTDWYAPAGGTTQYRLTASFNENRTDVNSNTSNITCTATIQGLNYSGWSSGYNSTLTIYWHDNRENYDRYVASINISTLEAGGSRSASGTIDVTHNNDGNLSGYAYASFNKGGTSAYTPNSNGVTTDWTALTYIPRYATMTGASSFTDIQNPSFTYTNPRNLTMSAWLEINPVGTHYAERTITNAGTSGTYTWQLTEEEKNDLRGEIPNSKTGTCRIGIYSTIGSSTQASYKDVTYTIVNGNPTFSASYEDTNATTLAITSDDQQIIRNQSTLQIDVSNATAIKEATLSSVKTEINGTEYNATLSGGTATFNIGTLNLSSNTNAVVTLTDSRGFTTSQTLELEILNWELPTAIITLQRENNYYSNTSINVDANYSSLDSHNTITLKTRYKKVTDSSYGSYVTLQDNVISTLNLDNNYQWDVQVLVQDLLGQTTYNLTLDRGIPIVYFDRLKRSVGVNCFPENNTSIELNGEPLGGSGIPNDGVIGYDSEDTIPNGFEETNVEFLDYSTSETIVGRWINNKPIYRKVVAVSFPTTSSTDAYTNHNISNIEMITKYSLIWYDSEDARWFNYFKDTTGTYWIEIDGISSTQVKIKASNTSVNWNGRTTNKYAIIEYTKTTD